MHSFPNKLEYTDIRRRLLGPETPYYRLAVLFSAIISLLTLAVPVSIQMLIDQVANTALLQPVIVLAASLFGLLLISGCFYAGREYVLELYERHIYARMTSELAMKIMAAPADYFTASVRDELVNRYFDIMTLKKTVPNILIGGFTFMFQAAIGFVVTSLYHPALLLFNIAIVFCLSLVWRIWGWRAIQTSFAVSEAKYNAAAWLEDLARHADRFNTGPNCDDALSSADRLIGVHVDAMRDHFRITFQQLIALLLMMAGSSAILLGLGGWLVIIGELTLGQLVAAELILSAIFAGFALVAGYLKEYYALAAALEELDRFSPIPDAYPEYPAAGIAE